MGNVYISNHPLIEHKLRLIRDKNTSSKEFRDLIEEVAMLMTYEVTKDFPLEEIEVQTPLATAKAKRISGRKVVLVPILRAGLGMMDGMLKIIPNARIGHIGLCRDHETVQPVEYYFKMTSDSRERDIILIDPMLATGGSASAAIFSIKKRGARSIKLVCLIAAPEGISVVQENHPDVDIYVAAVDQCLNESAYIIPGLGDAGDRLFGTKG
ncbi:MULTISPECIES: uracil phosphoribosyltransferase [unclassified Dehalobacter]|uniref:uracil phosphoribosyltransferase n=1 Tax=unclassified Dehalobacter TaxID=2635733 RepID=UPI0003742463|nr:MULTISPECIES: uracil phosphoribosyltransferase [unclassified Dehalobacter]RJE47437.1 uracil phosphoribosyltransferase [Dehalobacter sp. MCB1]TCX48753.1 uracil phosphoribosyltransferase [Dehalobacter sp. 14DCB1]TCX56199.1 uracil phosphoribosyltransferase [Dehalobacter sp. 12DCB1]